MKTIDYTLSISAPAHLVWDRMLDSETYNVWAKGFSPDSQFQGEWTEGTHINFIDPNMGGTRALLEKVVLHKEIFARHVSMLDKEQNEDVDSEFASKWIGTTEQYLFAEQDGVTELKISTVTDEAFEQMFTESWPRALTLLKALCEAPL